MKFPKTYFAFFVIIMTLVNLKPFFKDDTSYGGMYHNPNDSSHYVVKVSDQEIKDAQVFSSMQLYSLRYLHEKNLRWIIIFSIIGVGLIIWERKENK